MKRDGECGFIPMDVGDSIKLRYYSGDCIGNPMIATGIGPNDYNGIIVDPETDRPVQFNLYRRVPKLNAYYPDRSIPAEGFWHYYDPFRFQQYHGVSVFKNANRDGFDIDQILEFTKMNIKWRASQLPSVHTETGRPRGAQFGYFPSFNTPNGVPTNSNGQPTAQSINVEGVTTNYLKLDESVMEYPNDFPNAQLQVSIEEFRRQCCKGAKLPYEFVYRADNGGVVQRFWVNKAENTFLNDKAWLRRSLLDRYKNRVIQKGIETGELDLSSFGDLDVSEQRFRGQWQMGRDVSVDYGKENDTDMKLIEAGLISPKDKVASMGGNLDDVNIEIEAQADATLAMAERLAKKYKLNIEATLPFVKKLYPNPPANSAAAGNIATPPVAPTEQAKADREERERLTAEHRTEKMTADITNAVLSRFPVPRESAPAAPNVTINNAPPSVTLNIPPQPGSVVNVQTPEVFVENHNHMAAAEAAIINIPPTVVNLPAMVTPKQGDIIVNVPQQPPPVVNVQVPPLKATLSLDRGKDGKLTGGEIT